MRKYEVSHPWITFQFRVDTKDYRFWLMMGEIASKLEHLSGVPLQPDFGKNLLQVYLARGALATTAIEGNTLSEEQVLQQVDGRLELPPSQQYLKQEVENILNLCNEEVENMMFNTEDRMPLCEELIEKYNKRILHDLVVEEDVVPGEYRTHSVTVGNVYRGAPPEDVPFLIDRLCEWLNGPDFQSPEKDFELPYAVIRSVLAHLYLAWIHAFGDGNGRTARLVEFHILFSSGVPLPAAHLLSDHYNRTRTVYYRELDKASKSGGKIMPFLSYALQGLLDGLRGQITEVRSHQMEVAWENYVHQQFKDKNTKTQKRRRDLVLELSGKGWINVSEIVELTPKTAKFYANVGNKMLQRDLNALKDLDLIEREFGRVRSRKRKIASFLPAKIEDNEK